MDEYIGIVKLFAGNFAPRGWALCNGALLAISQNSALFAILGTTYGGNGTTTFALPDLRSRIAVGAGNGPGLPAIAEGELAGSASVTLLASQMPMHTHLQQFANVPATSATPTGNVLAQPNGVLEDGTGVTINIYAPLSAPTTGNPAGIGMAGGSQPVDIMPPYLGMNYIICIEGLFPSRG